MTDAPKGWIEVPDFGGLVNSWVDAVQEAFGQAGDAVFGKDIKYNVVSSKAPTGSLYTISIELSTGDVQVVQISCGDGYFHTFFQRNPNLDSRTAAFISQFVSAMQSQWVLDPSKVAVQ